MLVRPPFYLPSDGGFPIDFAGAFNGTSAYMYRTFGTPTDATKFTIVLWVHRSKLGVSQNLGISVWDGANVADIHFQSNDTLRVRDQGASGFNYITTQVFRDPSMVLQIVVVVDLSLAAADRVKIYINGVRVTDFSTATTAGTSAGLFNSARQHEVGRNPSGSLYFNGLMAQNSFFDGQAYDPEIDGLGEFHADIPDFWIPKDITGLDYSGVNSCLLDFADDLDLGKDVSGQGNHWTNSGVTQTTNTPTNVYNTMNPIRRNGTGSLSRNNTRVAVGTSGWRAWLGGMSIPDDGIGQYYFEFEGVSWSDGGMIVGIVPTDINKSDNMLNATDLIGYRYTGDLRRNNSYEAYGDSYVVGDDLGVAIDFSAQTITFYKNGVSQGASAFTGTHKNWVLVATDNSSGTLSTVDIKCREDEWVYTPPTEHVAISTANLPDPGYDVVEHYFTSEDISHITGSVTLVDLPTSVDGGAMVRFKRTDTSGQDWNIFDTVRGANKSLSWNTTAVEDTGYWTDQDLVGNTFTLPSLAPSGTYQVEVFYIGPYFQIKAYAGTGATHIETFDTELDTAWGMTYVKRRDVAIGPGAVHHTAIPATYGFEVDSSNAAASTSWWNGVKPTTTGFTIQTSATVNASGSNYISYHWANSGPFRFGDYDANNVANGPFIELNGAAQVIDVKRRDTAENWIQFNAVNRFNLNDEPLYQNLTNARATAHATSRMDILSNGFKIRGTNNNMNASTNRYVWGAYGVRDIIQVNAQ